MTTARLALTSDGRITAYDVDHIGTCGGQTVTYVPLSNAYRVATTVYDIPLMHVRCRSMMTNTVPTAPFRGAGRPEATLVLERLIDLAAGRLGIDRLRIRQKNVIPKKKLPYRTASGLLYDSGDFAGNMKRMIELADWKGFAARKRESKKRGKLRGIGISNYLETPVGIPHERVEVTVLGHRQGRACGRHAIDRPGPRDELRPGDGGSARRASGGHRLHRRRHRENSIRQRHPFRPLDAARRHADGGGVRRTWWRRPRRWRRKSSACAEAEFRSPTACSPRRTATGG